MIFNENSEVLRKITYCFKLIETILMELGNGRDNTEQEVSKYKLVPINRNKRKQ